MYLTDEEHAWLAGDAGPATRRALEIVVTLARIYGAERLIPVESVQISGVSYRNLGDAGVEFLRHWVEEGARVRVPTTLNPAAMDMVDWNTQGIDADFAAHQQEVLALFSAMGVGGGAPVPTCTPYLIGSRPRMGAHVAWAESSAVVFANSVLGARTNREGGPGAIAAAIVGRTGAYGLHLDAQRRSTVLVKANDPPRTIADYSALGALVGRQTRNAVPYFVGLPLDPEEPLLEEKLKALGAAMAATGSVALYHVAGITPEARADPQLAATGETLAVGPLAEGYAALSDPADSDAADIDLVWIGCPHASLHEIAYVAAALDGRTLRIPLWVTSARPVKAVAEMQGLVAKIEAAGGRVFADACLAIGPVRELGYRLVATPSAKGAYYLRNLAQVSVQFAPLDACLEAALR